MKTIHPTTPAGKFSLALCLLFTFASAAFAQTSNQVPGVSNLPPAVSLINPTNGAVFYAPASISLIAKAGDPDGSVSNVEFFAGTGRFGAGTPRRA